MKPLDQYPTPETDALAEKLGDMPYGMTNPRYYNCRDLERRLAACRDALMLALHVRGTSDDDEEVRNRMEDTLALTAPKS